MAFDKKLMSLNSSGFGLAPRLFGYGVTPDTIATVIADGYFLEGAADLRVGDWIMVSSDSVSPLPAAVLIVQTITYDTQGIPDSVTVSQLV